MRYRVTAEYVSSVPTAEAAKLAPGGRGRPQVTCMGFSRGQVLPADAPAGHIAHLLRRGMVEEIPE